MRRWARLLICTSLVFSVLAPAMAQTERRGASGGPLPRFAMIKPDRARMRVGPGFNYATTWIYKRPGLPVEIIEEYSVWRQIRDADGTEGWMHVSVLSSQRNAMVAPWLRNSTENSENMIPMKANANDSARDVASIEPGVIVRLEECDGTWCELEAKGVKGFMHQKDLWGVYPNEVFN
ncbi:SH3 domain-containing protein [Martelella limonii]|uniref:SH3 domain-containing protein n=1 Tax=Martelella limonii TaxID=1647649 RepID=UPI00157FE543|nr:SH3 domain-containing protein [Martelella limonii]